MKNVIGLGSGGHAKVVIEIIHAMGGCRITGLLDPKKKLWGSEILGIPVLGGDNLLSDLQIRNQVQEIFIGLGSVGNLEPRKRLYKKALTHGIEVLSVIHPQTIISPSSEIGYGVTIMAGAIINSCVRMGNNVVVNTGAIIEHDCIIGKHVFIATGVKLASTVNIGDGTHIGVGASVRQCVNIGRNAIIGAGAVVVSDVPDCCTVAGVPARDIASV